MDDYLDTGLLKISLTSRRDGSPIEDATVEISYPDSSTPIEVLKTDSSGQTEAVTLRTPPVEYSMVPSENEPYAQYNIKITMPGFEDVSVYDAQVMSGETSILPSVLTPLSAISEPYVFVIPANTLFGDFPPKIAESEIKPTNETGEIVLSRVVVPEYVVVHDGPPTDSSATNHYVRYRDYIKNVASSEIYSTWPESTLRANILAIMSFTMNRVYTEWYRNQGYDFTITSSTAYDHKWIPGRNIFESISLVVDDIFNQYLSRPNVKQPILTQYCDGKRVSCPNWMSQWGSKALGEQNYSDIEIIQYYYGDDMYINSAEEISGIPASWPGYNLEIGSSGSKVRQLQEQLNRISDNFNAIPKIAADGIYGERTAEAVRKFQQIFNLPQTGMVDFPTWYKISDMYVRLSRIAELE